MNVFSKAQPAILSYQQLVSKCAMVGEVDSTVRDLWAICTPMPYGEKRILFPENFFKWAEQLNIKYDGVVV